MWHTTLRELPIHPLQPHTDWERLNRMPCRILTHSDIFEELYTIELLRWPPATSKNTRICHMFESLDLPRSPIWGLQAGSIPQFTLPATLQAYPKDAKIVVSDRLILTELPHLPLTTPLAAMPLTTSDFREQNSVATPGMNKSTRTASIPRRGD